MTDKKIIVDISFWQDPDLINYDKLAAQIDGVILRAAYGTSKDTKFEKHYTEFRKRNVPVGAYHYIIGNVNITSQANAFLAIVAGKTLDLGLWMDVEDTRAGTKLSRKQVLDYAALVPSAGIYTSASKWQAIMGGVYLTDRLLWVAHYGATTPKLPDGWTDYYLWQYTSEGRLDGYNGNLDMNKVGTQGTTPPEPDEVLYRAKVTATAGLRVRTGAGLNYPIAAPTMVYGTIVEVYEVKNGWCRHNKGGWSDGQWLERINDEPEPPVTINTPYYGALYQQRDPRWKDKPLGSSTSTIGGYGCAITAEANCLNQLGIVTNPYANNKWRTENGGYRNGNLIEWAKVSEQHPEIVWEGRTFNPTDAMMLAKINSGCALVILVDHKENTPELDEHWVNSVYRGDNQIWIFDPWDNQLVRLRDRYKKAIQQFTSYRRA